MMPHSHCIHWGALEWYSFFSHMAIGIMYFVFAGVRMQQFNWQRTMSMQHDIREGFWLVWVFICCGSVKIIHGVNIFIGSIYVLAPIVNTLELPAMFFVLMYSSLVLGQIKEHGAVRVETIKKVLNQVVTPKEIKGSASGKAMEIIYEISELAVEVDNRVLFMELVPTPMCLVDKDMNYLAWSKSWEEKWDCSPKVGDNHYELFPNIPKDFPQWVEDHKRNFTEGKRQEGRDTFDGMTFDWVLIPVNENNEVTKMMMVVDPPEPHETAR